MAKKFFLNTCASLEERTIATVLQKHHLAEVYDFARTGLSKDAELNAIIKHQASTAEHNFFLPGCPMNRLKDIPDNSTTMSPLSVYGVPVIAQVLGMFNYRTSKYEDWVGAFAADYIDGLREMGAPEYKIREILYQDRMARSPRAEFVYEQEQKASEIMTNGQLINLASGIKDPGHEYFQVSTICSRFTEWAIVDYICLGYTGKCTIAFIWASDEEDNVVSACIFTSRGDHVINKIPAKLPGNYHMTTDFDDRTKMKVVQINRSFTDGRPMKSREILPLFGYVNYGEIV